MEDIWLPYFECMSSPVNENILHKIINFARETTTVYETKNWGGHSIKTGNSRPYNYKVKQLINFETIHSN